MSILFWVFVSLLFFIHVLRHTFIRKEGKFIFWLSVVFDSVFVGSAVVIFRSFFEDSPSNLERSAIIIMVIAYMAVDQLFVCMMSYLSDHVKEEKVQDCIDKEADRRANKIIEQRNADAFRALLDEKLGIKAKEEAERIVKSRDTAEFERLREEKLSERVQQDFDKKLQSEIEKGAKEELLKRLHQEMIDRRKSDVNVALWIALAGSNKAVSEAFGMSTLISEKVFAVPYWVHYDPETGKAQPTRFNSTRAYIVDVSEVNFVSGRWNKIEGTNQIVLEGAIISRPE